MADLNGTAIFKNKIRKLETTDPKHPDTWNPNYQDLLNNTVFLKQEQDNIISANATLDGRVGDLETSIDSAPVLAGAIKLDWYYSSIRTEFELFTPTWTLLDMEPVDVISGIAGDDSIDVQDTSVFTPNEEYVLFDGANTEIVKVTEILTSRRLRIATVLANTYDNTASIGRTSFSNYSGSLADSGDGGVYFSKVINLGDSANTHAAVVRKTTDAADILLYWKPKGGSEWQAAPWAWKRTGDPVPDGYTDIEYYIPSDGYISLKLVVSGAATQIEHIVGIGMITGLEGEHHPPETPVNTSPADGAINVMEEPTLAISSYSSAVDSSHYASQWQISDAADFSNIIYDSGETFARLTHSIPAGTLTENKTYYFRARVQDEKSAWSDYSSGTSFTTAATFVYIATPDITSPSDGATDKPESFDIITTVFDVVGGTDTHIASQFQIRESGGTYDTPVWDSGETADLEATTIPEGFLQEGERTYYIRARHKGSTYGWSDYSTEISIVTKNKFAQVAGVALMSTGGGAGTWEHINGDGNYATLDSTYFNNHPVYSGIIDAIVDSQAMVKIPKFYYKVDNAPVGSDAAGKKCWWISDNAIEGFKLHPAFMDAGVELDYFLIGKYECVDDPLASGTKAASLSGYTPLVNIDFPTMKNRIEARNNGSTVTGFHMQSIYEYAAIQMLMLVELGTPDVQSAINIGNTNSSAAVNTGTSGAVWRGIYELWGNVWNMCDGLQFDTNNQLNVFDTNGNNTYISTGITQTAADGWIVSARANTGTDYDLTALFIPDSVDSTEGNGTYADYVYAPNTTKNNVCYTGGNWINGSNAGLFNLLLNNEATTLDAGVGGRLAKV